MASNVTPVGNNPFQPGMVSETYIPDQLIAGDLKIVTLAGATVTSAVPLKRGQLLTMDPATQKWTAYTAGTSTTEPGGVLCDDLPAPSGDTVGPGIYLTGQFNGACTTPLGSTLTGAEMAALRNAGIFIKTSVVTASDPT